MKAHATYAWASLLAGTLLGITSCATTVPQRQMQRFFVPPSPQATTSNTVIEPPVPLPLYAKEVPRTAGSMPQVSRPSDVEFLLRSAEDRFAAGKRAQQEGRVDDARHEFDRAIEILLSAPEQAPDRARLERRLDELVEDIYHYDIDQLGAGQQEDDVSYEKSPLDGIIDMTFPVDPNLRNRVQDQIRSTASQLPLESPDSVVSFINYFSSTQGKKIIAAGLRNAGRYKPLIERIFREEGVPQELIYLAQAESGFQPRARSNKECVGIWQFATFRGREYGLTQTEATDDRMDPEKATRAAARHLHDLYDHFGNWTLAMAAYNCGPNCVDNAVLRTGYADFWELRRLGVLPQETNNYIPIILAMALMGKNPQAYGLENIDPLEPVVYDSLELESPTHLALIADAVDRPLTEIRELNPSLLRLVAPAGFTVHIPKGSTPQVMAAFEAVPASRRDSWRIQRMEGDDSAAIIARRYGILPAALSAANRENMPAAGAWLAVPVAYPGDPVPVRLRSRRVAVRTVAAVRTTTARRPLRSTAIPTIHSTAKPGKINSAVASSKAKAPLSKSAKSPSSKSSTGKSTTGKAVTPARRGTRNG